MDELKFNGANDEASWRTPSFRQNVVTKIYELIQKSGMPTTRNSIEMENHVFQKAKSREDYLGMVARLIIHFRDINSKKTGQNVPGLAGINQPNNPQNPNQSGPSGNQMPQANNPNNGQGNPQDPINALQNLASQGSRNNQMMPNMGPQGQMQVPQNNMGVPVAQVNPMQNQMAPQNPMVQSGPPQQQQQNPPITATNLLQTFNQRPQLPSMQQQLQNKMGPNPMGMMPNQNMMGANVMAGQMVNPMGPGGMPSQMTNPNMSGGGPIPNQMPNNPMAGQMVQGQMNPNMAGQMMVPNQMAGQMPQQMSMMHMQQRKPGDAMNPMMGQSGPPFQTGAPRGTAPGQFLRQSPSPSAPSPAAMGGPSPASMGVMAGPMPSPMSVGSSGLGVGGPVGGVASPALAPSPSSHHPQQHSQHMQQHQRSLGMAPSPSSSLNTPLGAGAVPSPSGGSADDHAYREKVRQLSKYIDPLRRMIERMVNDGENVEKLTKMKKMLDILSNPSQRMPLETLLKCEVVLEKLDFKRGEGMSQPNALLHGMKDHQIFSPLLEVVSNTLQSPLANHTFERTFGPCIEALCGPEIKHMPPPLKRQKIDEPTPDIPDILQGEIARLDSRFKVSLEGLQVSTTTGTIRLIAQLEDACLPCVPPVSVSVPRDYPTVAPSCHLPQGHYGATPFLRRVGTALEARLSALPRKYSLSQLLDTWEMSVRQACNPLYNNPPANNDTLAMGA